MGWTRRGAALLLALAVGRAAPAAGAAAVDDARCAAWIAGLRAADADGSGGLSATEFHAFLLAESAALDEAEEALPWQLAISHKALACRCQDLGLGDGCCLGEDAEIPLAGLGEGEETPGDGEREELCGTLATTFETLADGVGEGGAVTEDGEADEGLGNTGDNANSADNTSDNDSTSSSNGSNNGSDGNIFGEEPPAGDATTSLLPSSAALARLLAGGFSAAPVGNVNVVDAGDDDGSPPFPLCYLPYMSPFTIGGETANIVGVWGGVAAVALAIEHLNAGNGSIVSEVAGLDRRCPLWFTSDSFDTELQVSQPRRDVCRLCRSLPLVALGPGAWAGWHFCTSRAFRFWLVDGVGSSSWVPQSLGRRGVLLRAWQCALFIQTSLGGRSWAQISRRARRTGSHM